MANTTGSNNTAVGAGALNSGTTSATTILPSGMKRATNLKTRHQQQIEIGNKGLAVDHNMIRIGVEGLQAKTFVAGIYETSVSGNAVMVNSSGQLGVVVSSERFKRLDIVPMGSCASA